MRLLGILALTLLGIHTGPHFWRGELHALLWLSNVATLVLGVSCLFRWVRGISYALLWLGLCALLWVIDIAVAKNPVDTAVLTHVGGFGVAVLAVRAVGMARATWYRAALGAVALVLISRLFTEPRHNVNLAFAVMNGWEARFPNHGLYVALLATLAAALFFIVEQIALRLSISRAVDYSIVPVFIGAAGMGTAALLGWGVPSWFVSVPIVGVLGLAAFVLERLRPARLDYIALDQPFRVELLHFLFNYNLGYALAMMACAGLNGALDWGAGMSPWPSRWPVIGQLVLAGLLAEGVSYWQHRLYHRVPWLWRFHALHHAGSRLNLARVGRFHFMDIGPGSFMVFAPLVLLRAPEFIMSSVAVIAGTLGVVQHANMRVRTPRWLDRVICTPAIHRLHHSRDPRESDTNFGTLFMVFDHLWGSYAPAHSDGPKAIGIVDDPVPKGFLRQTFAPFRR